MKQSRLWLLALLTILTLVAGPAMAEEGAGHLSGSWELGMSGINTDDNAARVNEYGSVRAEDGISLAPKLDLEFENGGFLLEVESETKGPRDQKHELSIDAGRVFKLNSELSVLEHIKDHETLSQMGATGRDDIGGSQPTVSTDAIFAELQDVYDNDGNPATTIANIGGVTLGYDAAKAYAQEVSNDYIVTRREWKNEAELVIPQLPNITFKAGVRIETREGMEQAIGLSKCDGCHVSATGKNIDERTEDFTLGATGKFGLLTVDYEYLNRNFNEDGATPTRYYDVTQNGTAANQIIYSGDDFEFARTPDSEKESHMIKARLDLPRNTSITASYVKADIESSKSSTQSGYELREGDTLQSELESFAARISTKFGKNISLSLRGKMLEIDADENTIFYQAREDSTYVLPFDDEDEWLSAEAREETQLGTDVVIRLAKATTLRLGYEYEEIDRDEKELGETETHTIKAALKTRINSSLSGRISYEYQNIDEPFAGAEVGIAQVTGTDGQGGLMYFNTSDFTSAITVPTYYWTAVYPSRELESSNQPEDVHEVKLSTTWAPAANMAATLFLRYRYEENDEVEYEQSTFVPGFSFWYAPSAKLNLTMSYTFNNQDTENRACVGWYHG